MHFLEVRNISFEEHGAVVVQPLSFVQERGQKLALAGESGAGKSTVLQLIAGLVQPSTGQVVVQGSRVRGPAVALVPGHPGVAYLSQRSDLPKFLRVEQVLQYAGRQAAADAHTLYKVCRIDHLLTRRTAQLSGGEQQRVALARLLLGGPSLLLLDEPFSNLDRTHKQTMQAILAELSERLGITCLLVSHDATDTLSWADELLVLRRGHLVQRGTPQQLYNQPLDEYTAALFGDYNLVRGADRYALSPSAPGAHTLLIRPEHFRLERGAPDALQGVVRAVRFFGSYYEVEVALPENVVRARVGTPTVAPGDVVDVSLATRSAWAIE